jgi:hypothetical protein
MKHSSMLCASVVALAAAALTTDGAFAAKTYNASHSNMAGTSAQMTCPTGETATTNLTTGKQECVKPDMAIKGSGVPKNASKNISDGAAKGQADEGMAHSTTTPTPTAPPK